jgi:hypothetical protein
MAVANNKIIQVNQCDFDCHADAGVQYYGAHRPVEHTQGFTQSHWMPPLGKCLHRIASSVVRIDKFVEVQTTQNTNKHNF